jgi:hypothetical protein
VATSINTTSARVSPVFPALSFGGFAVALMILIGRLVLNRPKRNV